MAPNESSMVRFIIIFMLDDSLKLRQLILNFTEIIHELDRVVLDKDRVSKERNQVMIFREKKFIIIIIINSLSSLRRTMIILIDHLRRSWTKKKKSF